MSTKKAKRASGAQARMLAELWGADKSRPHHPGLNPTMDVLVRESWVELTGDRYVSASTPRLYRVSDLGIDALEDFLRQARYARQTTAKAS